MQAAARARSRRAHSTPATRRTLTLRPSVRVAAILALATRWCGPGWVWWACRTSSSARGPGPQLASPKSTSSRGPSPARPCACRATNGCCGIRAATALATTVCCENGRFAAAVRLGRCNRARTPQQWPHPRRPHPAAEALADSARRRLAMIGTPMPPPFLRSLARPVASLALAFLLAPAALADEAVIRKSVAERIAFPKTRDGDKTGCQASGSSASATTVIHRATGSSVRGLAHHMNRART